MESIMLNSKKKALLVGETKPSDSYSSSLAVAQDPATLSFSASEPVKDL